MKYYVEKPLRDFEFWSGAKDTAYELSDAQLDDIEEHLESISDEWTETQINDIFWFEEDFLAEILGYSSWEYLIEDVSSSDVEEANEWAEELCDNEDFIAMENAADAGDLDLIYPADDEWDRERNIEKFREWWESLSEIKMVKVYRNNN